MSCYLPGTCMFHVSSLSNWFGFKQTTNNWQLERPSDRTSYMYRRRQLKLSWYALCKLRTFLTCHKNDCHLFVRNVQLLFHTTSHHRPMIIGMEMQNINFLLTTTVNNMRVNNFVNLAITKADRQIFQRYMYTTAQ